MLVNSSLSNDSLVPQSFFPFLIHMRCYVSKPASFIFFTTSLTHIFITLLIIVYMLYHGAKQWRQNLFPSTTVQISHTDVFTYHVLIIELIGILGYVLLLFVSIINEVDSNILSIGSLISVFHWYGQSFFHVLTCLERYVAVVYPITYMNLRNEKGSRIRNLIICYIWLICFVGTSVKMTEMFIIADICFFVLPLSVVSFCSLSVLWVLIRPGPGESGGGRERVDQSKQRAFYTIIAILGVLVLRFIGCLLWKLVFVAVISNGCLIMACVSWFGLPSNLVLPLLFLHRAGKLVFCKNNVG